MLCDFRNESHDTVFDDKSQRLLYTTRKKTPPESPPGEILPFTLHQSGGSVMEHVCFDSR